MARKLEVEFIGDTSSLERAFKTSGSKGSAWGGLLKGAGKAGAVGIAAAGAAAVGAGSKMIDLASDAQETASKFKTVFGKEAGAATKALDAFSAATGTSRFALKEQAAQFQALIRPMGLSTKNAGEMSVGMTKLATDLASFNNSSVEEAITALQSGLVGESEPLRRFGVQLSAARVEAFAYAEGIAKQGAELTAAQKAQAAYGIIMKDTTLAQGDAVRTSDSFANQFKRLKSQVTDLGTELGVLLLPIVTKVVGAITGFLGQLKSGEGAGGSFKDAIVAAFEFVKTAISTAVEFAQGWLKQHKDDLEAAKQAAENVGKAIKWAFEEVIKPVIEAVLPAVQKIVASTFKQIGGVLDVIIGLLTGDFKRAWEGLKAIVEGAVTKMLAVLEGAVALFKLAGEALIKAVIAGFKALPGLLIDLAGWLTDRWEDAIKLQLEALKAVGKWILDRLVEGLKAAVEPFVALGGWLKNRLMEGLVAAVEPFKELGGWILDKIIAGFKAVGGKVRDAVTAIKNAIADAIKDVFKDALSIPLKISLPKIDLPFGGSGGGNVGPGSGKMPSHVSGFEDDARAFGNVVTSGYRPGDDGYHGLNRARDFAGGNMLGFAKYMASNFGSRLTELIHTPLGFGIKNGQRVGLGFWGAAVNADHFDHVHVALAGGGNVKHSGWALVGENGPELAHLPAGATVYSNRDSAGMLSGGPTVLNAVLDLGRGIQQRVTLEFDEHGRQQRSAYWAGA